jgi:hypothetical protein
VFGAPVISISTRHMLADMRIRPPRKDAAHMHSGRRHAALRNHIIAAAVGTGPADAVFDILTTVLPLHALPVPR